MKALGRLLRIELIRLATSPRWALVLAVTALVAWLAGESVEVEQFNTQLLPGAFDVHAAAANNLMFVGYLLFSSFIFLVGDALIRDRSSGYARLIGVRGADRRRLWTAKILSVACAAAAVQACLLGMCVGYGAVVLGLSVTARPSALARASAALRGLSLFPAIAPEVHMGMRQVLVGTYLTLGFVGLATVLVALSIRFGSARLPVTLALLGLMADYVAAKGWEPWRFVSPGVRLLEATSSHFADEAFMSAGASVAYFTVLLAVAAWLGGMQFSRMEL